MVDLDQGRTTLFQEDLRQATGRLGGFVGIEAELRDPGPSLAANRVMLDDDEIDSAPGDAPVNLEAPGGGLAVVVGRGRCERRCRNPSPDARSPDLQGVFQAWGLHVLHSSHAGAYRVRGRPGRPSCTGLCLTANPCSTRCSRYRWTVT